MLKLNNEKRTGRYSSIKKRMKWYILVFVFLSNIQFIFVSCFSKANGLNAFRLFGLQGLSFVKSDIPYPASSHNISHWPRAKDQVEISTYRDSI